MSPRGPSRASKYRKPAFAKTLKTLLFFEGFWVSDPRRLPRSYLGLFGDVLSHLGAILETRAFKIAPASWDRWRPSPRLTILGSILGPNLGLNFTFLGGIFWTSFWTILGSLWGPFWDQIGPRRGQDEPKTAIKSFKDPKTYICNICKKLSVF